MNVLESSDYAEYVLVEIWEECNRTRQLNLE